jgi:hypothetical protein
MRDHENLRTLCDNCLLHLYSTLDSTKGFVPTVARNAILVKFLKPKAKALIYKALKRDIKTLILTGRKATMNLEATILDLKELNLNIINAED